MKIILTILGLLLTSVMLDAQKTAMSAIEQERFNKTFNVVTPSQGQIDIILKGGPDAVKMLDSLLQNTVRESVTMSQHLVESVKMKTDKLEGRVEDLETKIALLSINNTHQTLAPITERPSYEEAKKRALGLKEGMRQSEVELLIGTPDSFKLAQMGGAPGVERWQGLVHEYIWKEGYAVLGQIRIVYRKASGFEGVWIINNFDVR